MKEPLHRRTFLKWAGAATASAAMPLAFTFNHRQARADVADPRWLFVFAATGFVARHHEDMCVVTVENTSVTHPVAQERSITGNGFDGGRTLMEAMAMKYGGSLALPNCNMAPEGFRKPSRGTDVPNQARGEVITDPLYYGLSTHGYAGLRSAPAAADIAQARGVGQGWKPRLLSGSATSPAR